jgi:hypothetical protein
VKLRTTSTIRALLLGTTALCLAACSASSVQNSLEPKIVSQTNPITQSSLQFAVGTANVAGTAGLNAVVTLRQTVNDVGASILVNAPTITGPAGFVVPAAPDAFTDAGTASISGSIITSVVNSPPLTTFDPNGNAGAFGIASSMGIIPAGVVNPANLPSLLPYPLPFYAAENPALSAAGATLTGIPIPGGTPIPAPSVPPATPGSVQLFYIGGPPAFVAAGHTSTQDGTFTGDPPGYQLGFTDFQAPPVAGAYNLSVTIPTGINTTTGASTTGTKTATSTLVSANALPAWTTAPVFTPDRTGGGTIALNFPASGAATEEYVELVDLGTPITSAAGTAIMWPCDTVGAGPYYYTFKLTPGQTTVTVPDKLGAAAPGGTQGSTVCDLADNTAAEGAATPADDFAVYGFAVDWPLNALVSAEVANANVAAPTVTGAAGTDDITTSPPSFSATISSENFNGATIQSRLRGVLHYTPNTSRGSSSTKRAK